MLDEQGFKRKTYEQLFTEIETEAKAKFGETINTKLRSPLGILLRLFAWFLAILWQLAEKVYYSGFISTATGSSLDRLLPYGGIKRHTEDWAKGEITIEGEPNTLISAGFQVANANDVFFETIDNLVIGPTGKGTIPIQALYPGVEGNVDANLINVIVNPNPNVTSVYNLLPTSGGRNKETDLEAKQRFNRADGNQGSSTLDSIYSEVVNVEGVRTVMIMENDTDSVDVDGRPPHSFETLVLGGATQSIGEAIFRKKPAGIRPYGTQQVTVKDLSGRDRIIRFSFATTIDAFVKVSLVTNSRFQLDGESQVKTKILQYIGGSDVNGTIYSGVGLGEDVVISKLIQAVLEVPGIDDVTIEIGRDGVSYTNQNLVVAPTQVAESSHEKVVITVA